MLLSNVRRQIRTRGKQKAAAREREKRLEGI